MTISEWIAGAPTTFREAVNSLPPGWTSSERLLRPVLRIKKSPNGFQLVLCGERIVAGEAVYLPAFGADFAWVADGTVIRPLPADTPEKVSELIGSCDTLSFSDVVRLLHNDDTPVAVVAEPEVFTPARVAAQEIQPADLPPGLNATLFPYQAQGVRWMQHTVEHTGGLILADEMGLGKTVQIIALILTQRPSPDAPALIVCPTSLIANWRREIFRFAPDLTVLIHRGSNRTGISGGLKRAEVVITTYDTIVIDVAIFRGLEWSWLICDEAQALKNPDAKRRVAIASLPRRRTIPMTGTPVETSLENLWSLTDLAIPRLLGSRESFLRRFPDEEDAARDLAAITAPIILRRRVVDVAGDLPPRLDIDVPLELGDDLSRRYEQVLTDTLARYASAGPLVATGQLQLFCAHPWLQGSGEVDACDDARLEADPAIPQITPKLERTVEILEEAFLNNRKVLIFALFNKCGGLIRDSARHLPTAFWGSINGSTPQSERQHIVDEFSAYNGPACLVLNPRAAGTGLNITAATIVIHYTQAWNPALEAQASARAHRRGQVEPVAIFRLFYENTVERVMVDRSEWRRTLGNDAVPISTRDDADLRRALSLRPDSDND